MSSQSDRNGESQSARTRSTRGRTLTIDPARIREARLAKLWSQEMLADKAGVAKRTIENLERGRKVFSETIRLVAEALDIDPDSLVEPYKTEPRSSDQNPEGIGNADVPCRLLLRPGTGQNRVVSDRASRGTEGAGFWLDANVYLAVARSDIELIALWCGYYGRGCLCEYASRDETILLDSEKLSSRLGRAEFKQPTRLAAETTHLVQLGWNQAPPLRHLTPADIDAERGDLVVEPTVRVSGEDHFRTIRSVFSFDPKRGPKEVQEVREPPRMTDRELESWHAAGRLSDEQYQRIIAVNPGDRYLASISPANASPLNLSQAELRLIRCISQDDLGLLRKLYGEGPPKSKG